VRSLILVVVVIAAGIVAAQPRGSTASRRAMETCNEAGALDGDAADAMLVRGMREAEAAVSADPDDALAHFAVFCTLGKQLRRRGPSLWSLFELRRLQREIDRTLELAPDFADAMAGKGALLLGAPRLLGGNAAEAEQWLRRAVALDPEWLTPRLDLVRALRRLGADAEAAAEARRALALAERSGDAAKVARARALLGEADPTPPFETNSPPGVHVPVQ
jgi:tetratricopeptide (TPR) repeat protein